MIYHGTQLGKPRILFLLTAKFWFTSYNIRKMFSSSLDQHPLIRMHSHPYLPTPTSRRLQPFIQSATTDKEAHTPLQAPTFPSTSQPPSVPKYEIGYSVLWKPSISNTGHHDCYSVSFYISSSMFLLQSHFLLHISTYL